MDYKFLFIVTSAIVPFRVGSANTREERYQQTLKTIQSIREKVPDAFILLTESSSCKLSDDYKNELEQKVDLMIECYEDPILQQVYSNLERNPEAFNFGKSLLETRGMILAFEEIIKRELHQKVHRIFKFTGRYFLNDNFDIHDYCSRCLLQKYVFGVCKYNDQGLEYFKDIMGIDGQLVTGLWSFCSTLMLETYELYQKAFQYIDWVLSTNNSIDIERCLYKMIDINKVIDMKILGFTQIHGPNGNIHQL